MVTPDQSYWYVPDARTVQLGSLDSLSAYVIRYRLDAQTGHCTVALSGTPVNSSSQIGNLYGAGVFEPQNGRTWKRGLGILDMQRAVLHRAR